MSSETTIQILLIVAGVLALLVFILIYCLVDSARVLNWFITKYKSEPGVIIPPKRNWFHRFVAKRLMDLPSESFVPSPYYSNHL